MYRLVYEKKFENSATATAFLNASGWEYQGRRGWLSKRHLYEGVTMTFDGQVTQRLKTYLFTDGYVRLYADYNLSRTISMNFPMRVWRSKEAFDHIQYLVLRANRELNESHGGRFCIKDAWSMEEGLRYDVHRLYNSESGIGTVTESEATKEFPTVRQAMEWAKKQSQEET